MASQVNNNQKQFEILEHTADLRIKAFGKSKEELFKNALKGMASVLKEEVKRPKNSLAPVERDIVLESPDTDTLLVDFLSEALSLGDANQEVYFDANFNVFVDNRLEGKLVGVKIVEEFDEDIKAVTYHEVNVKQVPDGTYEAILVFDI